MIPPENVELCPDCGAVPIYPESVVLQTPKWCYKFWGECRCEPTEDASTDAQEEGVDIPATSPYTV